jgi:hypothetical protein
MAVLASPLAPVASAVVVFEDDFDAENSGEGALNYTAFANWTVTEGSVDIIGNGFVDVLPGNGLYIDLDGTTGAGGTLQSRELALPPGLYQLRFALSGNHFNDRVEAVTVRLGDLYTESFSLPRDDPFTTFTRDIRVEAATRASIVFRDDGSDGDNGSMKLDGVALLAPCPEPVAWWRAEGDATDSAGDNHGVLANGAGFAAGVCGQAFDFTGPGYVEVPEAASIDFRPGDSYSIAFWAYRTGGEDTFHFLGKRNDCGEGFDFVQVVGDQEFPVPKQEWVLVALVSDGVGYYQVLFSAGGSQRADGPATSPSAQNDAPWRIGISAFCSDFEGYMDEVMIFDRALAPSELEAMFANPCEPLCRRFLFDRADCNGDGEVDISDPVCTLNWLFLGSSEPVCLAATNVNEDAEVDISDPVYLLSYLFLGGPAPLPPFRGCGLSNAADEALGCETPPETCR